MNSPNENLYSQTIYSKIEIFWRSVNLFITKPHTISRQLAGAEQVILFKIQNGNLTAEIERIGEFIKNCDNIRPNEEFLAGMFTDLKISGSFEQIDKKIFQDLIKSNDQNNQANIVLVNKLLPKNLKCHENVYELVVLDFCNSSASFITLSKEITNAATTHKTFTIKVGVDYEKDGLRVNINHFSIHSANDEKQKGWLQHVFFPKFLKWLEPFDDGHQDSKIESLSLLNLGEYNTLYNVLKEKYGQNLVKIWPERTDPAKFVYEDVAIATYLLLIWKREREQNDFTALQSFVDLGCGNGLLVYILSSEGHRGYGIDIRKRGIWDMYPSTTDLRTEAITPSAQFLYPDIDWIIGNHSDELSPWVPIIAARSSYKARYFLLPCCAYEFSGKKYQRRNCQKSQYLDFLDYAHEISDICGFHTEIDRLKIPSTKRICLIGGKRLYEESETSKYDLQIQGFIEKESESSTCNMATDAWNTDFKPRSSVEKIQNCTRINKSVAKDIIDIVFMELIAKKRYINDFIRPDWNFGGKMTLEDLVKRIPKEKLKELKSECGGLQTLLKNNSQIFQVINGIVEIRMPVRYCDKLKELKQKKIIINRNKFQFRQRPCWFLTNHPDGCPFTADDCSFKH